MTTNDFYTHTAGMPASQGRAVSPLIFREFDLVQNGFDIAQNYSLDTGTVNAMVITPPSSLIALSDGLVFRIKAANTITGPVTVNMGATLGTKSLRLQDGTPMSGQILANQIFEAVWDATAGYLKYLSSDGAAPSGSGLPITGGTMIGPINEAKGADIPSATTVDLQSATGNELHITGTTTITAFTLPAGADRDVIFDGALILTNSANLVLPGATNIATAAGDRAGFRGDSSGVVRCMWYTKADGTAVLALPTAGYINGFGLSNDVALPNSVLDIAAGTAIDSTNTIKITGTAFTKSTAGTWAAGTAGNGMGSGLTIANSTWYHVFAIINNGAYDVYFDTSVTAANKPTNTTAFRRIGSFLTDGSAHIVPFSQNGQMIYWHTQAVDFNGTPPATATLVALTIPPGVSVYPLICAFYKDISLGNSYQIWTPATGSVAKSNVELAAQVADVYSTGSGKDVLSNTSQQIYHRVNGSNAPSAILYTTGWIDPSLPAIA